MSTTSETTFTRRVITRHFESSRHQRSNLVAAFQYALPVIRRNPAQSPAPRHAAVAPGRQRRAIS